MCWISIFSLSCIDQAMSKYCKLWKKGTNSTKENQFAPTMNQKYCDRAGTATIGGITLPLRHIHRAASARNITPPAYMVHFKTCGIHVGIPRPGYGMP